MYEYAEYLNKRQTQQEIRELMFTMSMCLTKEELRGMRRAQEIIAKYLDALPKVTTRKADEVVLCNDCTYCHKDRAGNMGCFHYKRYGTAAAEIGPNDFCSYGRLSE